MFNQLVDRYHFEKKTAFGVTTRVFRGGGLTKDAVYLQGLHQILNYLGRGKKLEPLFVGKISLEHIQIIQELRYRGVLKEPPLTPRFLTQDEALKRLTALGNGMTVLDLVPRRKR